MNSKNDSKAYGNSLAENVAVALMNGKCICYSHREYCGMGLIYENEVFYYCEVTDGCNFWEQQSFQNKKAFVSWLAKQSDYTMSRAEEKDISEFYINNQCLTKDRLRNAAEWIDKADYIGVGRIDGGN